MLSKIKNALHRFKIRRAASRLLEGERHEEVEHYVEYYFRRRDYAHPLNELGFTFGVEIEYENNGHPFTQMTLYKGAERLYAIREVVNLAVTRRQFDDLDYESLCRLLDVPSAMWGRCMVGTQVLVAGYRELYSRNRERTAHVIHRPVQPELIQLPQSTEWQHASNELVAEPEYHELPNLTPEWHNVQEHVQIADDARSLAFSRPVNPPTTHLTLQSSITRVIHPPYGVLGSFNLKIKSGFRAWMYNTVRTSTHKPTTSVIIGDHIPFMLPRFDRRDPHTTLYGAIGRIGRRPVADDLMSRDEMLPYFNRAVDYLIDLLRQRGLAPQDIDSDMSFKWLASTRFPTNKKIAYLKAWSRVILPSGRFVEPHLFNNEHKAFAKNENYLDGTKPQRLILAGNLEMAAVFAPACAILGNYFFSLGFTSKKIPLPDRPRIAVERFGQGAVITNDMSAWEGSIDIWTKTYCEHRVLGEFFPNLRPFLERANEPIDILINGCHIRAPTMRCSGDPQTSLGNSMTNICSIIAAYLYSNPEGHPSDVIAWVEGDDSIVRYPDQWQFDPACYDRYHQAFVKMGYSTKMEIVRFVGDAGYCSCFFDADLNLCPRIAQTFIDFPFDHSGAYNSGREKLALKAISLHNECGNQPLAWALARHYGPDRVMDVDMAYNGYEYEELIREGANIQLLRNHMRVHLPIIVCGVEPTERSRRLFFAKYGITPAQQEKIERRILRYGQVGLCRNDRGVMKYKYLRMLCEVDGVNYEHCRQMYTIAHHDRRVFHPDCHVTVNDDNDFIVHVHEHPRPHRAPPEPRIDIREPVNPMDKAIEDLEREHLKIRNMTPAQRKIYKRSARYKRTATYKATLYTKRFAICAFIALALLLMPSAVHMWLHRRVTGLVTTLQPVGRILGALGHKAVSLAGSALTGLGAGLRQLMSRQH